MADRRQITQDIKSEIGNFPNLSAICRYLGCGYEKAVDYLRDVPYIKDGKEKRYLAIDIARMISEKMVGGRFQ